MEFSNSFSVVGEGASDGEADGNPESSLEAVYSTPGLDVKSEAILALNSTDAHSERFVPVLGAALGGAMNRVLLPILDGLKADPIRDGDSNFLSCALEAQKPGLLRGQVKNLFGGGSVAIISVSANGCEDDCIVGGRMAHKIVASMMRNGCYMTARK